MHVVPSLYTYEPPNPPFFRISRLEKRMHIPIMTHRLLVESQDPLRYQNKFESVYVPARKFLEAQLRKEEDEKRIRARKKKREKLLKKRITRKVKSIHPQQAKNSHSKLKELR